MARRKPAPDAAIARRAMADLQTMIDTTMNEVRRFTGRYARSIWKRQVGCRPRSLGAATRTGARYTWI